MPSNYLLVLVFLSCAQPIWLIRNYNNNHNNNHKDFERSKYNIAKEQSQSSSSLLSHPNDERETEFVKGKSKYTKKN